MSQQLPPSRFGAGYTYGGRPGDQPPPPTPAPAAGYSPDPGYPPYQAAHDPYAATYAAQPAVGYPPAAAPVTQSRGGGAAIFAGILAVVAGIAHAAWSVPFLLRLVDEMDKITAENFKDWQFSWMIGSSIAQVLFGLLLLIGGFRLMGHRGRGMIGFTCIILIAINIASVVIGYTAIEPEAREFVGMKLLFQYNGVFYWFGVEDLVYNLDRNFTTQCVAFGALMVVSVVAMIMAFSASTRRQSVTSSRYGY